MAKLITNEQLASVVEKLMEVINTKVGTDPNDPDNFCAIADEGIRIGSLVIQQSQNSDLAFLRINTDEARCVVLNLDALSSADVGHLTIQNGYGEILNGTFDYIKGGGCRTNDGGTSLHYAFPTSSNTSKALAHSSNGGGIILTSKNRTWESQTQIVDGTNGRGASDSYYSFNVAHDTYTEVVAYYPVELVLEPFAPERVDEYWIEVIVPANIFATSSTVSSHPIKFTGLDIKWANGEPDWREIGNRRVQIHIMNGIATYVSIPYDSTNNLNE